MGREVNNLYGFGSEPISRGYGTKEDVKIKFPKPIIKMNHNYEEFKFPKAPLLDRIKYHIQDYYGIYLIILGGVLAIGCCIYYEYEYPCVSGHYEQRTHFIHGPNNQLTPYTSNDFICDCRTVRDSIK